MKPRALVARSKAAIWFKLTIGFVIFAVIFSHGFSVYAATKSELIRRQQQLAVQARIAREQAAAKQREADEMKRQIVIVDRRISAIEDAIASTRQQMTDTQNQINDLNTRISAKQDELAVEKAKMEKLLSSWYMQGETGLFTTVVGASTVSEAVTTGQYYETVQQQIRMGLDRIEAIKKELDDQKAEQDRSLASLQELTNSQSKQESDLESERSAKQRILSDTKSAISALNAEAQAADNERRAIQSRINVLSGSRSWGTDIVSSEDGRWYYSQLDYPNVMLGNSDASVAQYGCFVTSIAMVATYYGHNVTPPMIASNRAIFSLDGSMLVTSPPGIGVTVQAGQDINWGVVDAELSRGHPVIVSLYIPSVGAINSDGSSHFVVIRGKAGGSYLMHDPLGPDRGYSLSQVRSMKLVTP